MHHPRLYKAFDTLKRSRYYSIIHSQIARRLNGDYVYAQGPRHNNFFSTEVAVP